jgi:hypothetical protein
MQVLPFSTTSGTIVPAIVADIAELRFTTKASAPVAEQKIIKELKN